MTKRIFRSVCFAALSVFFASAALFMGVLYHYFSDVQRGQLRTQTELAARAVAEEGMDYLEGLDDQGLRITWIGSDGAVLYDSQSDSREMENHLEREEIREALAEGMGESARYSATLMERSLYCARRLPDGTVLRLAVSQNSLLTLLLGMTQPICFIFLLALILSLALASRLSRHIVAPLNRLDLEQPLRNEGYDELAPLLRRIDAQQREIRRQQETLQQKQKEFDAVTENMAEGIVLLNARGTVLSINRAAKRLFDAGHPCIGQHVLSVSRNAEVSEILRETAQGRTAQRVVNLAGGRYQLLGSPVVSGGGVSGAVLLALDVTEKERAEQMRREFTANVSHELKTPLHTIAGSAELLESGMVKEEDRPRFYTRIHSEALRMSRLVEDIIHLSHLDEGAADMRREETDLYAIARETVQTLSGEAKAAGVSLTVEGEPAVLWGVPRLLESIVYNLCDNAVKYNRPGGSVTVSVHGRPDVVELEVSDTGIGIPKEHQERIFERFYRVDKSRSKELGGTGLGLSIVKHAARLHDASIELHSEEGSGTRIRLTFPAHV